MSTVAEELDLISSADGFSDAAQELLTVGREQSARVGTPLFFRKTEQRPESLQSELGATLQSQQILTAGMLRPAHLLDLIRNFTVFQQVDGKTRKIVSRYQQFRAIQSLPTFMSAITPKNSGESLTVCCLTGVSEKMNSTWQEPKWFGAARGSCRNPDGDRPQFKITHRCLCFSFWRRLT